MQQELRRQCLFGALQGGVAIAMAALLLWALLPVAYPTDAPTAANASLTFPGRDFAAVAAASAGVEGGSSVIQAMQMTGRGEQRIGEAVWRLDQPRPAAGALDQLRLQLEGVQPDQVVILFWRTAAAPEQLFHAELEHHLDGVSWHDLWRSQDWEGELRELTLGVFGPPGSEPLRLRELGFHGINRRSVVTRLLAEWRYFKPWRQSSANRYPGVLGEVLIHPAAAAGLWATLALALMAGWQLWRRDPAGTLAVAGLWCLLLPWLALDYLWQGQLERQLRETRAQFGALTQAEKHSRDVDADLQRYATHLQQSLQPLRNQRLFLLHDATTVHNYARLRLQFKLLPLNIYNYGNTLPAATHVRPGDLVLLLNPVATARYHPARRVLDDGEQQVAATLLDRHPFGSLYRIEVPGHGH